VNVHNGKLSTRSDHRKHDRVLVSRFAMADAYPGEIEEAQNLVATCSDCAALAADIRAISASMARLPTPGRTRDFTITAEQAEKLSGNAVSRWLRTLSTPRWATVRPVAGVALSIGLVMAVIGGALPTQQPVLQDMGGRASAPLQESSGNGGVLDVEPNAAATPAQNPAPAGPGGEPLRAATADPVTIAMDHAYMSESTTTSEPDAAAPPNDGTELRAGGSAQPQAAVAPGKSLLIYAGLAIAALSLGLLTLAWAARRWFSDPLLR
jgi:hypothetical protein